MFHLVYPSFPLKSEMTKKLNDEVSLPLPLLPVHEHGEPGGHVRDGELGHAPEQQPTTALPVRQQDGRLRRQPATGTTSNSDPSCPPDGPVMMMMILVRAWHSWLLVWGHVLCSDGGVCSRTWTWTWTRGPMGWRRTSLKQTTRRRSARGQERARAHAPGVNGGVLS